MTQLVPAHVHVDAIAIGKRLEGRQCPQNLGGKKATDYRASRLKTMWHSKLTIFVFDLSDGYRYYCGLNKQGMPVAFDIYRPATNHAQKRRSR